MRPDASLCIHAMLVSNAGIGFLRDTNRLLMALVDTTLRGLKPQDKPKKYSDGGGLFLLVNPNGSKLWRLAYRFDGKQKTLAFGAYPPVSLADGRCCRTPFSEGFTLRIQWAKGRV